MSNCQAESEMILSHLMYTVHVAIQWNPILWTIPKSVHLDNADT